MLTYYLMREYYTTEALEEMHREFSKLNLPDSEFPQYVAWCYENENAPADPRCW